MIKTRSNTIFILKDDGSKTIFEAEELQTKIIKSCINSGMREAWLAEDITLAIEYALHGSRKKIPTYTEADINSMVIKVLEQAGYPEVANSFRQQNKEANLKISSDLDTIKKIIMKYLDLEGKQLALCSQKVFDSCRSLKMEEISPVLILELGKYYKDKLYPINDIAVTAGMNDHVSDVDILGKGWIEHISEKNIPLYENCIVEFCGINYFLPAVKIDLNLNLYLTYLKLDHPLTEMAVIPTFPQLADAVNELMDSLYANFEDIKNLPIYLRIVDIHNFAETFLDSSWPECENVCQDLIEHLQAYLCHKIYKVSFL
jgi:transcriptional regulator NrdR family protein